jgi:hypothetical protein
VSLKRQKFENLLKRTPLKQKPVQKSLIHIDQNQRKKTKRRGGNQDFFGTKKDTLEVL